MDSTGPPDCSSRDVSGIKWVSPRHEGKLSGISESFDDDGLPVSMENVYAASKRIEKSVVRTPCIRSKHISKIADMNVYLKCEYKQSTGSFKERGSMNAILRLPAAKRKAGIIAASAGNHALSLAYGGSRLSIPVTVVMPTMAPLTKKKLCAELGAEVIVHGDDFDIATAFAKKLAVERGMTYIHGFNDAAVIAGQGSAGVEILSDVPDLDAVLVPVGGGGLIAGIAMAIKNENPNVEVIGIEPVNFASCTAALQKGEVVETEMVGPTIADGLAVRRVGDNCFPIIQRYVDRMVVMDERWTALSVLRMMELEKTIVEGAGAIALGPLLAGILPEYKGKNVVLLICGANIDLPVLGRVIDYGLVADGRLSRVGATISDRPGGLAKLCALFADVGASIKEVQHLRTFTSAVTAFSETFVEIVVETRDHQHKQELKEYLVKNNVKIDFRTFKFYDQDAAIF